MIILTSLFPIAKTGNYYILCIIPVFIITLLLLIITIITHYYMLPTGQLADGWQAGSGRGGWQGGDWLAGRVGPGGDLLACRVGQGGSKGGGWWAVWAVCRKCSYSQKGCM